MVRNSQEKDDCFRNRLFQLYSPCGELYCFAVIFGLRRVILSLGQFCGEYNITLLQYLAYGEVCKAYHFHEVKISLRRSRNITKISVNMDSNHRSMIYVNNLILFFRIFFYVYGHTYYRKKYHESSRTLRRR